MDAFVWGSYIALWILVLVLGFLLLGALRSLDLLGWRLEQLEAKIPSRVGRDGLRTGTRAPDFSLKSFDGASVALSDFAGRKVLLVFTQPSCRPCERIVPALNASQRKHALQVVAISNGDPESTRAWATETGASFPVLTQESWKVSRRYQALATPFAFLIDEDGVVVGKGIVSDDRHVEFLLAASKQGADGRSDPRTVAPEGARR